MSGLGDSDLDLKLLVVEYEDRFVALPRISDYATIIAYLQRIFTSLKSVPSDRIVVTVYSKSQNVPMEVVDFVWEGCYREVDRISVKIKETLNTEVKDKEPAPLPKVSHQLEASQQPEIPQQPSLSQVRDTAESPSDSQISNTSPPKSRKRAFDDEDPKGSHEDDHIDVESIDEPLADRSKRLRGNATQEAEIQAQESREDTDDEYAYAYEEDEDDEWDDETLGDDSAYDSDDASPPAERRCTRRFTTLPIQPRSWGKIMRKDTLRIYYRGEALAGPGKRILIKPETTTKDLKRFIESRSRVAEYFGQGRFTYIYESDGSPVREKTAGEVKRHSGGYSIYVHVPEADSIFNLPDHLISAVIRSMSRR